MKASIAVLAAAATLVSADGWSSWQNAEKDPKTSTWVDVKDPQTWKDDPDYYHHDDDDYDHDDDDHDDYDHDDDSKTWSTWKAVDPKTTTWAAWDNYGDKSTKTKTIYVDRKDPHKTWLQWGDEGYGHTVYVDKDDDKATLTWDEWTKKPADPTWTAWNDDYYNNKDKTKTIYINKDDKAKTWFNYADEGYKTTVYYDEKDKSPVTWAEWLPKPKDPKPTTWADDYYTKTVTVYVKGDEWKTVKYDDSDKYAKTVYVDKDSKSTYTWSEWAAPTGKKDDGKYTWSAVKDDDKYTWSAVKDDGKKTSTWADVKDDKKPYTYYTTVTNKVETYCPYPTTWAHADKTYTVTKATTITLSATYDAYTISVPLYTYAKYDCGKDDGKDAYTWQEWKPTPSAVKDDKATTWAAVDAKQTWSAVADGKKDDKASTWSSWADASTKKDDKASTWSAVKDDSKASTWSAVKDDGKKTSTWSVVNGQTSWYAVPDAKTSTWSVVNGQTSWYAVDASSTWSAVAAGSTWADVSSAKATGTGAWSAYGADASKTNSWIAVYTGSAARNAAAGVAGIAGLAAALL